MTRSPPLRQSSPSRRLPVRGLPRTIHRDGRNRIRALQDTADQVACRVVPDDRHKKGISAHQIHRMLGISYKSTWFMMHRLREAMRTGGLRPNGRRRLDRRNRRNLHRQERGRRKARAAGHKNSVLTLVERGGSARSFPC